MARYEKGEFILTPNKNKLRGMKPQLQCLFMWLCEYSDIEDSTCYPSRKRLASDCGIGLSTLDRSIKELEDAGLISKMNRYSDNEKLTNLYTIMMVPTSKKEATSPQSGSTPPPRAGHRTNLIRINPLNSTIANAIEPKGFGNKDINELYLYWENVCGYRLPSSKENRYACSNLLKKHSVSDIKRLIDGVAMSQGDRYAPRISDMRQLQSKFTDLIVWGKKQSVNKGVTL